MRVGHGFDVHALVEGRKLVLGGVVIDHPLGLAGHSDADVITHAVIDALLGAAGLGDIGMHFPDSDPAYRDASSMELLGIITHAVGSLGYTIENVDVTLMAQEPKIGLHRPSMVENLAAAMGTEPARVNVKATTTEGLGFVGRVEGIAASAVALLKSRDDT
ncbi:MAG: 2-C-methyl-D-erythritol 2,4-cyclodiphosphate synthase [Deltaproteobacteria bacterium]|nr:2-C-methyl-D-erythritol 2,4-cyclodiphosphate synthase [Deltaproteobacteria bacterium]